MDGCMGLKDRLEEHKYEICTGYVSYVMTKHYLDHHTIDLYTLQTDHVPFSSRKENRQIKLIQTVIYVCLWSMIIQSN